MAGESRTAPLPRPELEGGKPPCRASSLWSRHRQSPSTRRRCAPPTSSNAMLGRLRRPAPACVVLPITAPCAKPTASCSRIAQFCACYGALGPVHSRSSRTANPARPSESDTSPKGEPNPNITRRFRGHSNLVPRMCVYAYRIQWVARTETQLGADCLS